MFGSILLELNEVDIIMDYFRSRKVLLNSPNYVFDRKKQAPEALDGLSHLSSFFDTLELTVRSAMSHLEDDEEDGGQVNDDDDEEDGGQVI